MNKTIILIGILVLVFVSGCENPFDPNYDEVCKEIYQPSLDRLDYYKELSMEQSKELSVHSVTWISPEDFIYEVNSNCLLIVTNGKKPQQNQWYVDMGFTQFDSKNMFPVIQWDLQRDQIFGQWDEDNSGNWKYWLVCKK